MGKESENDGPAIGLRDATEGALDVDLLGHIAEEAGSLYRGSFLLQLGKRLIDGFLLVVEQESDASALSKGLRP